MTVEHLQILERFCGPPNSGNGGYVCGVVAKGVAGPVAVRLKAPPPLNTVLTREWSSDGARLMQGATLIAEAKTAGLELNPPHPPHFAQATRAAEGYPGFKKHLFPRCFVCGPARAVGDGLRIFPGPVDDGALYASPWVPDASLADGSGNVAPEFIWAALDCPSAFALPGQLPEGTAIVLGELCASVVGVLKVGQPAVVTAWPLPQEGRRRMAGSAVHSSEGALLATARAVWIEVPATRWNVTG